MMLSTAEANLFFKLNRALMCYVNQRRQIVPNIDTPDQFSKLAPGMRLEVRKALLDQPDLLTSFIGANPFGLTGEELEIVSSWRHYVAGKFFVFRYLAKHTIFLVEEPPTAYGVVALTDPFEKLIGPDIPRLFEAILLPFNGKIVYDGLLSGYGVSIGPNIRRNLNGVYKAAKERVGVVTSLPIESRPLEKRKPKKAARKPARAAGDDVQEVLQVIVGMTDQFCSEHLNLEYANHCRLLAEKLARKRPSPLLSGKPNTWACAIIRTIGWVNFLDDRSQTPHMKLTAIDKVFGVGESTGQGKSKQIRTMLRIGQFDPIWTLPSRVDDNPLIWMLEVNGLLMDIRRCPREAQEIAFEKGLIPYIPADR